MRAWTASGPRGTNLERVKVRLLTYHETHHPDADRLRRFVVQAVDRHGLPVAEDPILEARITPQEVVDFIAASIEDGWHLEPEREPRRDQ